MSGVLDAVLVGGALLASILYALATLAPRSWQRAIGAALAACGLGRFAPKSAGACGGCDNCGAPEPQDPAAGAETRIGIDEIGRRKS